jgi:hypothetical protein
MLLSQEPTVAASRATHLYSDFFRSFIDSWKRFDGHKAGLAELLSEQEAFEWIGDFSSLYFARVAQRQPGARIILEKTPGHALCGSDILRVFPESYFIHVIRDPRAVVTSLRAASRSWGTDWAPGQIADATAMWENHINKAQEIGALTPQYYEMFYENLHMTCTEEIMRLFEWLGEPINCGQARTYAENCAIDNMRPGTTPAKYKKLDKQFFRRGQVDSWRWELSATEIAIVERLTKKQMAKLGYEPVSGRRARLAAKTRLRAYRYADRFAKAVRAGADWIKP